MLSEDIHFPYLWQFHEVFTGATAGRADAANAPVYKSRCFDPFSFPAATDALKQKVGAIAEELYAHRKRVLAEHDHLMLTGL